MGMHRLDSFWYFKSFLKKLYCNSVMKRGNNQKDEFSNDLPIPADGALQIVSHTIQSFVSNLL